MGDFFAQLTNSHEWGTPIFFWVHSVVSVLGFFPNLRFIEMSDALWKYEKSGINESQNSEKVAIFTNLIALTKF